MTVANQRRKASRLTSPEVISSAGRKKAAAVSTATQKQKKAFRPQSPAQIAFPSKTTPPTTSNPPAGNKTKRLVQAVRSWAKRLICHNRIDASDPEQRQMLNDICQQACLELAESSDSASGSEPESSDPDSDNEPDVAAMSRVMLTTIRHNNRATAEQGCDPMERTISN